MFRWKIIINPGGGEPGRVWYWQRGTITPSKGAATGYKNEGVAKTAIPEIEAAMKDVPGHWERKLVGVDE